MKLNEDFDLKHDGSCWVLEKNQVTENISKKTGKPIVSSDKWYYPSIKQALRKFVNESLVEVNSVNLLLERLDEVEETISKIRLK